MGVCERERVRSKFKGEIGITTDKQAFYLFKSTENASFCQTDSSIVI